MRLRIQTAAMLLGFVVIAITSFGVLASKLGDALPQGTLNKNHASTQFEITNTSSETITAIVLDDPAAQQAADAAGLRVVCETGELAPGQKTVCGLGSVTREPMLTSAIDAMHSWSPTQWVTAGGAALLICIAALIASLAKVFDPKPVRRATTVGPDGRRTW